MSAQRFAPPDTLTATLAAIVEAQIAECRSLLRATELVESAVAELDFDAVDRAMADRARAMARITELEEEVSALRGKEFSPPPGLENRLAELRSLVRAVEEADRRAREAADRTLLGLRQKLKDLALGQQGLRGYRPAASPFPRFTDRKG